MLSNYFKIGFRNLVKRKVYSGISILGLSISLAVTFVATAYILFETRYNRDILDNERIYCLMAQNNTFDKVQQRIPYIFGGHIASDIAGVESLTSIFSFGNGLVKLGAENIEVSNVYAADKTVFATFGLDVVASNGSEPIAQPNTIAISKSVAERLFGSNDPINKDVVFVISGKERHFTVDAVFSDLPQNTTVKFDYLVNIQGAKIFFTQYWIGTSEGDPVLDKILQAYDFAFSSIYVKLSAKTSLEQAREGLAELEKKVFDPSADSGMRGELDLFLEPFSSIYWYNSASLEAGSTSGNRSLLYVLSFITLFILIIGVTSYVMLTTALSSLRFKEIGVRKVLGSGKGQLMLQTIAESMLTCLFALVVTFILVEFARPFVNGFVGKEVIGRYWSNYRLISIFISITLSVGVLSGLYTAFGIMRFNPIEAIKGGVSRIKGKSGFRSVILAGQVAVFIALITSTFVFRDQVGYATRLGLKDMGDSIIVVPLNEASLQQEYPILKERIAAKAWVSKVSGGMFIPPADLTLTLSLRDDDGNSVAFSGLFADAGLMELLNFKILEGRYMSSEGDQEVIVTKSAIDQLKIANPIGHESGFGRIVGVVDDFHIGSVKREIKPTLIVKQVGMVRSMAIKANRAVTKADLREVENLIEGAVPDIDVTPITFKDHVNGLYVDEQRLVKALGVLAVVSIILATMGLFGLSLFTLEQRSKEIGIRKISGASTATILAMLSRGYTWLTLIALAVAAPPTWFLLNKWLQSFASHTAINPLYFVFSALCALTMVLGSVAYQAVRVAYRNPVDSLKDE
ncbi:MAG: ABC transporter permease [Tenuifilaceae bacterium]|jgi:putative ABC transport system permease protein|nr:ABC transporter permease [Tenuifilaceae bacterium]